MYQLNKDLLNSLLNDLGVTENPNNKTITQSFMADSYSVLYEVIENDQTKITRSKFTLEFGFQITDSKVNNTKDELFTRWELIINSISSLGSTNPLRGRFVKYDGAKPITSLDNDNKKWIGKMTLIMLDSDCN